MTKLIDILYDSFRKTPLISIDSRKILPGCLFFGLKGEHVDGSEFGAHAIQSGAAYAVVRTGSCEHAEGVIEVEDPLVVLQKLAGYHRSQLDIPFIGITGSNGKTTTKELVQRVLASKFKVSATQGNLNNHIGVPLTLLSISPSDQCAIVEMGANHIGEIAQLCGLARPTHGVITNIGMAHLEGFGGLEGVKQAKSELYESLAKSGGVAFVNSDEPYLTELSQAVKHRVSYGFGEEAYVGFAGFQFRQENVSSGIAITFVDADGEKWTSTSRLFGAFNAANIATAIALGLFFRVPGDAICQAIMNYHPDNNRAQELVLGSNTFILDAYNANPTSMRASIESFAKLSHQNKYVILGAMKELGEYAETAHTEIAEFASGLHGAHVIFIGDAFQNVANRLGKQWYAHVDELTATFRANPPKDALIFIKGSRAVQLESLLGAFQ